MTHVPKTEKAVKDFVHRFRLCPFLVTVAPDDAFKGHAITIRHRIGAKWYGKTIKTSADMLADKKTCDRLDEYIRAMIDGLNKRVGGQ